MKTLKKYITPFFVTLLTISLLHSCANPGMPTGGEKDEIPPVVIKSTPEANALNFKGDKITIRFNELIQLKDVFSQFIASPPLQERPKITAKGDELEIEFLEELQENTTYTLDFANAVVDNNESNVLENFVFSFSTGEVIDSMSISGNVFDAETLKPIENCMVELYSNKEDSAFRKMVPLRIAKTDAEGRFALHNIKEGSYRLYALDDANRNYMYDQPGEGIAWLTDSISTSFDYVMKTDTLANDSVIYFEELVYLPDSLQLFFFQKEFQQQYLVSDARKERRKVSFFFNQSVTDSFAVNLVDTVVNSSWFVYDNSYDNDTINLWITDSTLYKKDTLQFELSYLLKDTLDQLYLNKDTLAMYFFEKKEPKKESRKKKKDVKKKPTPSLKIKGGKSTINLYAKYNFECPTPVKYMNKEMMKLCLASDTLETPLPFDMKLDTISIRKYHINHDWIPGESYLFLVDSAAIIDAYDLACKNLKMKFAVKSEDQYGKILVSLSETQPNWLLQVLSAKNNHVVRQQQVPANGKLGFRYITPGEYLLKIIEDNNQNGLWDTGDFDTNLQPEKVLFYPEKLTIKSNWQHEIPWNPTEFNIFQFSKMMNPKKDASKKRKSKR